MKRKNFKVRTPYNFDPTEEKGEVFNLEEEPSQTIPNQTLSLVELVERHVRGQGVATLTPRFTPDEFDDLPDLEKMDKIDRIELAREVNKKVKEAQRNIANKNKIKEDASKEETKPTDEQKTTTDTTEE